MGEECADQEKQEEEEVVRVSVWRKTKRAR